jgi:hypothetical protein
MCGYLLGVGLGLIDRMTLLTLSLAYAPVPREESTWSEGLPWIIVGILAGALVALAVFRFLAKSAGKGGR